MLWFSSLTCQLHMNAITPSHDIVGHVLSRKFSKEIACSIEHTEPFCAHAALCQFGQIACGWLEPNNKV